MKDLKPTVKQVIHTLRLKEESFQYVIGLQKPKTVAMLLKLTNSHVNIEEHNAVAQSSYATQ